jgi:hypothetical protein
MKLTGDQRKCYNEEHYALFLIRYYNSQYCHIMECDYKQRLTGPAFDSSAQTTEKTLLFRVTPLLHLCLLV